MSDVLRYRIRDCLMRYNAQGSFLDIDEFSAELLDAVLPVTDAEYAAEPIWHQLIQDVDFCTNCITRRDDCACCYGCGQPDSDIFGSHGYWCAL